MCNFVCMFPAELHAPHNCTPFTDVQPNKKTICSIILYITRRAYPGRIRVSDADTPETWTVSSPKVSCRYSTRFKSEQETNHLQNTDA